MKFSDILGLLKIARKVKYDPASRAYQKMESNVPRYDLPNALISSDGRPIASVQEWENHRRPEILELYRAHVFGRSPAHPPELRYRILESDEQALNGLATRKQVSIDLTSTPGGPSMILLLYLPNKTIREKSTAPVFLGLNFLGNHTAHPDPKIIITKSWIKSNPSYKNWSQEKMRGVRVDRWQVEYLLEKGYGLGTIYYGDIVPDRKDGLPLGIHPYYAKGQKDVRKGEEWGAIGAWAWGLSRCMDYLSTDSSVNSSKVAILGHSRLGKVSLWAGAQDERFALVISNNSGCGGAALSRRHIGETVMLINKVYPHWFCNNFTFYNEKEQLLPVDQHMLIGLIAPRPVYVASAQSDLWADPKGEFLSTYHAGPIYKLFGKKTISDPEMPGIHCPILLDLGYHIRSGVHGVFQYDWEQFVKFADMHFANS